MEKMEMKTKDVLNEKIERILELFPECSTEIKNSCGTLKRSIDFSKLKMCLGDLPSESDEVYSFTWAGKKKAYIESMRRITKTLRPVKNKSVGWNETQNIYIEGDNLDILKLLQESYFNSVRMIYIDPPYNTGSDFIYSDKFSQTIKEYNEEIGLYDNDSRLLFKNAETNGRFHSDWCSMIYSRLILAINLLTDYGVIFISIDDNEVENLKKICHEVFGESNFIGQWNWYKSATPPNLSKKIKKNVEYILCYEKKYSSIKYKGLKKNSLSSNGLLNQTNKFSILKFPANVVESGLPDGKYTAGAYGTSNYEINLLDDVIVKNGIFVNNFRLQAKFKWGQDNLLKEIENGTKIAIRTKSFSPSYEKMDYAPEVPPNLIDKSVNVDTTEQAGKLLTALFDNIKVFDYPKPVDLIAYLINFICDDNDIVMDFFSGSATTAHAVMATNAAQNKNRKFILVQLPENVDKNSIVYKMGFETICDIGEERIRRAGKKIKSEFMESSVDIGFRVFKLDETNMRDVYYSASEYSQDLLSSLESNVKSDRNDLDLLFGCLLEWGLPLSLPYACEKIGECTVHNYNDGDLIACFDENIPESVIKEIAKKRPLRAVFRDSSFANSPSKINVAEIFKLLAPDTRVKVI